MKRKQYMLALMLLTGTMMLAGCGKDKDTTVSQGQEQEASTESYDVFDYVELGEYTGLEVQYPAASVTDEDVELHAQDIIDEYTEYVEITDRPAAVGDCVNIDYTGTIDGEEFDGGSDTGYDVILGDGEFEEAFEASMEGANAGDTVTCTLTFPEDYWDEAVIGKTAEFTITINGIYEIVVPEYTDDFIKEVTDYDTIKAYEESLREELLAMGQEEGAIVAGEDALYMVIANSTITGYPQELYDACYAEIEKNYQFYAEMFEMEYEAFLEEYIGEEDIEDEVLSLVNESLVVQAIAEKEGLTVTDENYGTEAAAMVEEYEYETLEELEADYGKDYIQKQLVRDKVLEFLYGAAKLEEVPYDEYYSEDSEDYEEESTEKENTDGGKENAEEDSAAEGEEASEEDAE